jgi:Flp pilus assembly protein TadG
MNWERGSGLVEFTLLILVLMLLALGVFDFGIVIQRGMAISAAVRAGAEFGAADGNANNTAGMISAAQSAAPTISSLHVSAATWCACTPNGTTVSCGSLCNTYDLPIQYVQVNAGASAPVMFRFPGIPRYISLAGSSTLRAR